VALPFVTQAEAQAPAGAAEISVLSGRADLVSGGDALVAISLGSIRTAKITLISGNRVRDVGAGVHDGATGRAPRPADRVGWLTFQDAQGHVVYGGKPLGSAPVSNAS
jgi:hypothetical protein